MEGISFVALIVSIITLALCYILGGVAGNALLPLLFIGAAVSVLLSIAEFGPIGCIISAGIVFLCGMKVYKTGVEARAEKTQQAAEDEKNNKEMLRRRNGHTGAKESD